MTLKSMQSLSGDSLLASLNQAKQETKLGLCDVFTSRLERIASHIRCNHLSSSEAAELLEQEATKMQNEKNEVNT